MLNKKAILILFLLIIGILTMTSVSASDAAGDIVANASAEEIGINEENINDLSTEDVENTEIETDDPLKSPDSGTFIELNNKISNAKAGSTVILENDYNYNPSIDGNTIPRIDKSLTIDGKGHTINGNGQTILLQIINHNDVVLKNIKFTNGNAPDYAGVVHAEDAKSLRIYDCEFTNNIAAVYGGALVVTDTDYLQLNNTKFANNWGRYGGSIYSENTQNAYLFDCEFANNDAMSPYENSGGGAAIFRNFNTTYFGGCRFTENYADMTGGALYLDNGSYNVMLGCTFSKNVAKVGGAVTLVNMKKSDIYLNDFTENHATNGGAFISQNSYNTHMFGNRFESNHANRGGAINIVGGTCLIETCSLISNYCEGEGSFGGGIFVNQSAYMAIYNTDFSKNSGYFVGGLFLYNSNYCIIEKCNFTSNQGEKVGACLLMESDAYFNECKFKKNNASESDGIGGIIGTGGNLGAVLIDCSFTGNTPISAYDVISLYTVKLNIKKSGSTCDDTTIVVTLNRRLNNEPIANRYVKLNINGKTVQIKTNKKGQAIYKANLPAKSYVVTATHEGSGQYNTNSTKATVKIKKATPKIAAVKKTFKAKVKAKAYTITLKNSVGKIIKNANVKLTVKGKTFSARTNAKGQATFKITNLKNRGSFQATIKFAGNGYYNAVSKKAAIVVVK